MRCSRVGGVILYSFDNGHFMAYTSPPPTAEPLLKEKPFGECICQLSTPAMPDYRAQPPPRGSGQRSWTQGWRSQTEGEIFKGTDGACADPDTRIFPATGAYSPAPPSSFIPAAFTSHAAFFVSFLGSKKESFPFVPSSLLPFVPPRPTQKAPPIGRGFACGVKP